MHNNCSFAFHSYRQGRGIKTAARSCFWDFWDGSFGFFISLLLWVRLGLLSIFLALFAHVCHSVGTSTTRQMIWSSIRLQGITIAVHTDTTVSKGWPNRQKCWHVMLWDSRIFWQGPRTETAIVTVSRENVCPTKIIYKTGAAKMHFGFLSVCIFFWPPGQQKHREKPKILLSPWQTQSKCSGFLWSGEL